MDIPIHDPWFCVFVGWSLFSAVVSGMPEPERKSAFGYIWLYRSCHILSSQGTAYFAHKDKWADSLSPESGLQRESMLT